LILKLSGMTSHYSLVAETTRNYNLHFHSILKFPFIKGKNYLKYINDEFRNDKMFGYICVKQVDNESGWMDYLRKGLTDFKCSVGRPPILYDGFHPRVMKYESLDGMIQNDLSTDC